MPLNVAAFEEVRAFIGVVCHAERDGSRLTGVVLS
jgi:hypothetical protein